MAIKLWNLQTFTVQKTLTGHEHEVSGLAFLPSHADFLLSCSRDQSIRVWDTLSGTCLQTLAQGHTDWVKRVAVAASGALFASASSDESIIVWNTDQVLDRKAAAQSCIVATLDEHDHQIDCIAWATLDAARTIE
jgi:platelet-activating factor acetylhydrolase IB subunit alpha